MVMQEREIRNRLARHHFKLIANVSAVIDTSPPYSMYNSPKSVHYRPSKTSRSQSTDSLMRQSSSLKNGLQPCGMPIAYASTKSYNIYAARSISRPATTTTATTQKQQQEKKQQQQQKSISTMNRRRSMNNEYSRHIASIESKLKHSPFYQPPLLSNREKYREFDNNSHDSFQSSNTSQNSGIDHHHHHYHHQHRQQQQQKNWSAGNLEKKTNNSTQMLPPASQSTTALTKATTVKGTPSDKIFRIDTDFHTSNAKDTIDHNNIHNGTCNDDDEYEQFKEKALNQILLRRVFTKRVIEDCFERQIRQSLHLDLAQMQRIMNETMQKLGIDEPQPKDFGGKSSNNEPIIRTSSQQQSSSSDITTDATPIKTNTNNQTYSSFDDDGTFPLDAPPPTVLQNKRWNFSLSDDESFEKFRRI